MAVVEFKKSPWISVLEMFIWTSSVGDAVVRSRPGIALSTTPTGILYSCWFMPFSSVSINCTMIPFLASIFVLSILTVVAEPLMQKVDLSVWKVESLIVKRLLSSPHKKAPKRLPFILQFMTEGLLSNLPPCMAISIMG